MDARHWSGLLKLIAADISESTGTTITMADLVDFDLSFFDTTPAMKVGIHKEFISSPRLDNMMGTTIATHAMVNAIASERPADGTINLLFSYDVEEVGSTAYMGAAGTFTEDIIQRIFYAMVPGGTITNQTIEDYKTAIKNSLFLSADNGHALHPNYMSVMSAQHRPMLQGGIIIAISPD